jgi:hypothetical protein
LNSTSPQHRRFVLSGYITNFTDNKPAHVAQQHPRSPPHYALSSQTPKNYIRGPTIYTFLGLCSHYSLLNASCLLTHLYYL